MPQFLRKYLTLFILLAFCTLGTNLISTAQDSPQRVEISPSGMPFSVALPAGFPAPSLHKEQDSTFYESRLNTTYCAVNIADFSDLDKDELNANIDKYGNIFEENFLDAMEARIDNKWSDTVAGRLRRGSRFHYEVDGQNYYAQSNIIFNPPQIYTLFCASMDPDTMSSKNIQAFFTSFKFKE